MAEWEERAIERAEARNRIRNKAFSYKKPIINSLDDIKKIISSIRNATHRNDESVLSFKMGESDISAKVKGRTKYESILEGIEEINKGSNDSPAPSIVINGRELKPAPSTRISWVDVLVQEWMGGYRDGKYICWDINGDKYKYDIIQNKLVKSK